MQNEITSDHGVFTTANLIFNLAQSSLNYVPFHAATPAVARYIAEGFPLHLAIHKVSTGCDVPEVYTQSHLHEEEDEINIILGETSLTYLIGLEGEEHVVGANQCIFIPRGMKHSANVINGSGYFITLRIP